MKRAFLFFLMCLLPLQSFAAAVPAYSPNFGNAMAGVIQQKAIQRGFAANDPRYIATTAAVGSVLTGVATGLAAAAGAPLWGTIAVGAVAAGAVALGIGAVTEWLFGGNGTVTGTVSTPITGLAHCWSVPSYNYGSCSAAAAAVGAAWQVSARAMDPTATAGAVDLTQCASYASTMSPPFTCYASVARTYNGGSVPMSVELRVWGDSNAYPSLPGSPVPEPSPVGQAMSDAVADVPDAEMALPVNPELLAKAVNDQWAAAAAMPDYQGLPFSSSDPVTVADVQAYQAANPAAYPTVGDFLAPAVVPSGQTGAGTVVAPSVTPAPGTTTSPGINPAPAGSPQVNLGVDPVIGLPNLESTPTASGILAPILGLFPSLKTFVVPSHSSVCPSPSMDLFGKTLVLDGHCTLLETVRPTLYAVMAFVWVVIGLFIILAA